MSKRPSITAFFPACNDAGTIGSMVAAVYGALETLTDDFEVLVIENGSTDYTKEVLETLVKHYPNLRVFTYNEPLGYGGALRKAFAKATKDLIFYTDGDAQYNPLELGLLVPALQDDIAIVQGWKTDRNDPLHRIVIGRLYNWFVRLIFGLKPRDVDCDFRLIRREVFDVIDLESDSGTICLELVKKLQDAGFQFAEVPVQHYLRTYGKSQFFNFPRLWRTGIQLLELWWKLVIQRSHLRQIAERRANLPKETSRN